MEISGDKEDLLYFQIARPYGKWQGIRHHGRHCKKVSSRLSFTRGFIKVRLKFRYSFWIKTLRYFRIVLSRDGGAACLDRAVAPVAGIWMNGPYVRYGPVHGWLPGRESQGVQGGAGWRAWYCMGMYRVPGERHHSGGCISVSKILLKLFINQQILLKNDKKLANLNLKRDIALYEKSQITAVQSMFGYRISTGNRML